MIMVYVDDSGKLDSSPSLVLAGFSASEAVWSCFTGQWQEMPGSGPIDLLEVASAA